MQGRYGGRGSMNEREQRIHYLMETAHGRVIQLYNWWGAKYPPRQVKTMLREIDTYMDKVIELEEKSE